MVAPVVLITAGGILSNGLLGMYGTVNDRMRALTHERFTIVTAPDGTFLSHAELPPSKAERLAEIDHQLPMLLRRHGHIHDSVLLIFSALAVLVLGVIAIAVAVTSHSDGFGTAALALILAGTVIILAGLVFAAQSLALSRNAIEYEVSRTLSLGPGSLGADG